MDLQHAAETRRPFVPGIRQERRPEAARSLSNPDLAPHFQFVDLGGRGYAKVRLSADEMRTEFVCIPRPITRSEKPDGGPLRYRVLHTAALWKSGGRPQLKHRFSKATLGFRFDRVRRFASRGFALDHSVHHSHVCAEGFLRG
jgi:hypothetical protein